MKKNIILIVLGILIVIVGITGFSYALWSKTFTQTGNTTLASDCFNISFTEDTSSKIILENSFPITDEAGKNLKPYTFSITNNCDTQVEYYLNLETTKNTTMKDEYIRLMLNETNSKLLTENKTTELSIQNGKSAYLIDFGFINGLETKQYNLRIWMDSKVTQNDTGAMNATFESKISITGKYSNHYYEPILNGTDPIIKDNLIPITIENDGTVKKADREKSWYSYENKVWANAIILNDETKLYNNGEIIPESNIESYFVWIPRYKYKIFNEGNYPGLTNIENKVQTIEVIFENKTTNPSKGSTVGQWLTHPTFTTFDSNGMWVGKFESGYKGATTTTQAQVNSNDSSKLQIKPNVYSWRNVNVSNAHLTSFNYQRDLDSHMMKNTEWGSVAYLQHSKYGSQASVRINNNSSFITGYSAINEPTCGYTAQNDECNRYEGTLLNADGTSTKRYNSDSGVFASTTGNISGVYDMSGGAWEYVMGVMVDKTGKPMSGRNSINNSGFNGTYGCPTCDSDVSGKTSLTTGISFPEKKYYDTYAYADLNNRYDQRIFGDATGEVGPFTTKQYGSVTPQKRTITSWYDDESMFVFSAEPWFLRSSHLTNGYNTGVFAFSHTLGSSNNTASFRVVLTP